MLTKPRLMAAVRSPVLAYIWCLTSLCSIVMMTMKGARARGCPSWDSGDGPRAYSSEWGNNQYLLLPVEWLSHMHPGILSQRPPFVLDNAFFFFAGSLHRRRCRIPVPLRCISSGATGSEMHMLRNCTSPGWKSTRDNKAILFAMQL